MSTIPHHIVGRHTGALAIYCIPGEVLSHFYVRQSSESPMLTILEALYVNRFHHENGAGANMDYATEMFLWNCMLKCMSNQEKKRKPVF